MSQVKNISRQVLLSLAGLFTLTLTMAGCGSSDDAGRIQINSSHGTVYIDHTPKRIVTIGQQWLDTALAFGTKPIAYFSETEFSTGQSAPWVGNQIVGSKSIDWNSLLSDVKSVKPDLILVSGSVASTQPDTYTKISKIATTVPGVSGAEVDEWSTLVNLFGTITRNDDKAKQIVESVSTDFTRLSNDDPALKGKTYALAHMASAGQIQVISNSTDTAASLFTRLGMAPGRKLAEEAAMRQQTRFAITPSQASLLDADLIIVGADGAKVRRSLTDQPGYSRLSAVRHRAVAQLSTAEIGGLYRPTALSIPYLLDELSPQLALAGSEN